MESPSQKVWLLDFSLAVEMSLGDTADLHGHLLAYGIASKCKEVFLDC
jgi:hypothetical protein